MKMNTRNSRKKDLYSKSNFIRLEQSQSEAMSTSLSDTEEEQDTDDEQFEKFPSPTFNIHIHVPYYDSNNSKLYLPRIQPIINLHFDELARRLESKKNVQSKKSFYKTFQNLVAKISPKFGVVKFHFKNNSEQRDIEESNINNVTPNSSQRHNNDIRPKKNINSKKSQNVITETNETIVTNNNGNKISRSNSNNKCNNHAPISYELDKDIKLKKAVVVLTDICKTKNYKYFLEKSGTCKIQNKNIESSYTFENKLETSNNKQKCNVGIHPIKIKNESCAPINKVQENESCTSGSFITEWNNCCTDNDINLQAENHINNNSHIKKINNGDQNFTALVEGWNFSDILNRFQIKYSEKLVNCVTSSNGSNNDERDVNKFSPELNKKAEENKCTEEEDFENETESDNKLCTQISKNELDLNEKYCFEENMSETTESFSYLQYQNETVNDFLMCELDVPSKDSLQECKDISKYIKPEFASDSGKLSQDSSKTYDYKTSTTLLIVDECEIMSRKEMSSRDKDMEVIAPGSSSIESDAIEENKFEVTETNKSRLFDVAHPRFHLELIRKEMKRRALDSTTPDKEEQNLKSKKSDIESSPSLSTSSPKKRKLSNKKPEISRQKTTKSSQTEDFIRLNSSGPTEFYVTSLNEVRPSATEAKNFKRKMLFGNRVNRFSRSNKLRIYKLKKEAIAKKGSSINY